MHRCRLLLLALTAATLLAPTVALGHSVGQVQTTLYLAPETVTMLTNRAALGTPGFVVGDSVSYIVQFTPVRNSADVGPNGYVTAYIPAGVEVIGAEIVAPDASGGFVAVPPSVPAPISNGWGPRNQRSFVNGNGAWNTAYATECALSPAQAVGQCNGSLAQLYADTGIFYSTDARTAVFTGPSTDGRVRQGTNGYNISPSGESQLNPIIGQANATTHNLWDASQANAFGSTSAAVTALTAPASTALSIGTGSGASPYKAASPVAGPDTGYLLDNTGLTGPWKRIVYNGSRIGLTSEGAAISQNATRTGANTNAHVGGTPTSAGFVLSAQSPLPTTTNAVRFAIGRLDVGSLRYVRFTVRLTAAPPTDGILMNSEVFGGDAAQAAGSFGQDNPWRYHVPSVADNNSNLYVLVRPIKVAGVATDGSILPTDSVVTYRVTYVNTGNLPQTNVILSNKLPSQVSGTVTAVRLVSGTDIRPISPANPAASATFTFATIPTLAPGAGGTLEFDVRIVGPVNDIVTDIATLKSTALPLGVTSNGVSMISTRALLTATKSATPATVAPGGAVSYTLTVKNTGSATATAIVLSDYLPGSGTGATARFAFTTGSSVTAGLTGVTPTAVTPPSSTFHTGENRTMLTWNFGAQTLAAGASFTITYSTTVGSAVASGTYPSDVVVDYDNNTFVAHLDALGIAPVTVDGTAPDTSFDAAEPNPTTDTTGDFDFGSNEAGVTYECRLGAAAFASCPEVYATAALADGTYTLEVRARDLAGNVDSTPASTTWTVDTKVPDTSFDETEPSPTADPTGDFDFGSDEAGVTYECRIGAAAFATCAEFYTTATLADGTYTLDVRAKDAAGNVDASPATVTWTVDTKAPDTSFDAKEPAITSDTTGDFDFGSDEVGVTYECRLGADAFATCAEIFSTVALADGTYTIEVRAKDAAGNVDASPASYTWRVDTKLPDTWFDVVEPNPTNDKTGDFNFGSDEGLVQYDCRVNSSPFVPCAEGHTTASLADGTYTMSVRARDQAGNVDPTPATYTWTVDTTAPETSFDVTEPVLTNDPTGDFDFGSNETGATFECRVGSAAFAACTEVFSTAALVDGTYTIEVRAKDLAGNVDATPASYTWTVDLTPPDTTFDATEPSPTSDPTGDFDFASTEADSTFECRIGAAAFASCPELFATAALADGVYTIEVRATDKAGNMDLTPATFTWTVDTLPPDTSFDNAEPTPTSDPTGDFDFASDDPSVTYECRLGSAAFGDCDELFSTEPLIDGTYTLDVRAVDLAGNVDPTPASHTWLVDTTPPETSFDTAEPSPSSDPRSDFDFGSNEPDVTYECRIGDAAFGPCSEIYVTPLLADGTYTLDVRAIDAAGNVDPTPATYTWTVDTSAPDTSFDDTEPTLTTDVTGDFDFASTEDGSLFECRLGDAAFTACSEVYSTAPLADGTYTIEVRAVDLAGNTDPTPASYTWTLDTTPPDTSFDATEPDPTSDTTGDFDFASTEAGGSFECRIGDAAFAPCPESFSTDALADGTYTLSVRAIDAAGNVDPTPATFTWTVDTTPPDTSFDVTEPDPTDDTSGDFDFASTETGATFECRIGSASFVPCDEVFATEALADGTYTIEVRAVDAAGNVDPTPATYTWKVDTFVPDITPPDTFFAATEPSPTGDNTGDFAFGSNEGSVTYECRIGDAAFASCPETYTTAALPDGTYTLEVRAIDAAGNVDPTPASYTWTVDTALPNNDQDSDGIVDAEDDCPTVFDPEQLDLDEDGLGDMCDDDIDGDGIKDDGDGTGVSGDGVCESGVPTDCDDSCPRDPNPLQTDTDGDGLGNACDDDLDDDGVFDDVSDQPCVGQSVAECNDNCPLIPNADQADADKDGIGDACENDTDGDGVPTDSDQPCVTGASAGCRDNCPDVTNPDQTDTDGDGVGDACDADDDGDTAADGVDNCPLVVNQDQKDTDADGLGDACDPDDDDDGVLDGADNCPLISNTDQSDGDDDAAGDACDPLDLDEDLDDDTIVDSADNCPSAVNTDQADVDGDGLGDRCDDDLDGDGIANTPDNCPSVANADQQDFDGDGSGDVCQAPGIGLTGGACSTSSAAPTNRSGWALGLGVLVGLWLVRSRRRRALAGAVVIALGAVTMAGSAHAQTSGAVTSFHPSPFMQDLVTVGKGYTRDQGSWNVGLLLDYQKNPLVLRNTETDEIVRKVVSDTLIGDVRAAVAALDWLDLGLVLPVMLFQKGDGLGGQDAPGVAGIGDLEFTIRAQLFRSQNKQFALAFSPTITAPTGQLVDPYMGSSSVTFTPWLGVSYDLERFGLALTLGYRVIEDSTLVNLDLGDELLYRFGIWGKVAPSITLIGELEGGTVAASPFAEAGTSPLEVRAGARFEPAGNVTLDIGAGAGLTHGYATPDFRVYAGVNFYREAAKDRDGDGLMDDVDSCPDDPEDFDRFEDSDGCPEPDNDKDGICDPWVMSAGARAGLTCHGKDACENDPEDKDKFEDEDGCPDPDNDKDGVLDTKDNCPLDPEDKDNNLDEDGCPDPDDDADGICDAWVTERGQAAMYDAICKYTDKCPREPETINEVDDTDGCPDELAHVEGNKIVIMDKVYFFFAKAEIMPKSDPVLSAVLSILEKNPQITKVRIEGHTDTRGSAAKNKALSAARAKAVRKYLVDHGVDAARLISEGFGESQPIVKVEKTEEEYELNRRVEFTILDK